MFLIERIILHERNFFLDKNIFYKDKKYIPDWKFPIRNVVKNVEWILMAVIMEGI